MTVSLPRPQSNDQDQVRRLLWLRAKIFRKTAPFLEELSYAILFLELLALVTIYKIGMEWLPFILAFVFGLHSRIPKLGLKIESSILAMLVERGDGGAAFDLAEHIIRKAGSPKEFDKYTSPSSNDGSYIEISEDGSFETVDLERSSIENIVLRLANYLPEKLQRQVQNYSAKRAQLRGAKKQWQLHKALDLLAKVDEPQSLKSKADYWSGIVNLRGLLPPNTARAREKLERAACDGHAKAKFELALLLLQADQFDPHSAKLLNEVSDLLPKNSPSSWVASLEIARITSRAGSAEYHNVTNRLESLIGIGTPKNPPESIFHSIRKNPEHASIEMLRLAAQRLRTEFEASIDAERREKDERDKREIAESLLAMFSHRFRGSIGTLQFNAEHRHDERLYVSIARSMSGLLDTISVASTAPDQLVHKLRDDRVGTQCLDGVLNNSIQLMLAQLLASTQRRRMRPYYRAFAIKVGAAGVDVGATEWAKSSRYQEMEAALQKSWETEAFDLSAELSMSRLDEWIATRIVRVERIGFKAITGYFSHFGPKDSLLTCVLTEMLVNAVKFSEPFATQPISITVKKTSDEFELICRNQSSRMSRQRGGAAGTGRGLAFIRMIAGKIGGHATWCQTENSFEIAFAAPLDLGGGNDFTIVG